MPEGATPLARITGAFSKASPIVRLTNPAFAACREDTVTMFGSVPRRKTGARFTLFATAI